MRYAIIDQQGRIVEAHNNDTLSELPEGAILLSDEQWPDRFNLRWSGSQWVLDPLPEPEPDITAIREAMIVTRFQARAALYIEGLFDQVNAAMTDPQADGLARLAWTDAQTFHRTSPTVIAMGAALGFSDAQLDDLFTLAATLKA
jgi:hypothetical protein